MSMSTEKKPEQISTTTIASLSSNHELSTTTPPLPESPSHRIDGGLQAWLQVFACWLLFMNTWGLTNSFSVFESHYTLLFPSLSHSSVSWIGSLQLFLTLFIGIPSSRLLDAGYLHSTVFAGIVLICGGMLATSFCHQFWQLVLAQGVVVGVGSGMLAFTSAAVVPFWWERRRMLVAGIVSTGSSVAGVVYPLMMRELFARVGFGWAVRILALVMLVTLSLALVLLKSHAKHPSNAPLFDLSFLRDVPYTLFILAYAFMVAGVYVPYFFIQSYALDLQIDSNMTFNIVAIMNAATFIGRFPYNYLADMYGGISILTPCCLATSIILFLWRFTHTTGGLIGISATFCFVTGGLVSLPAPTIANMTQDQAQYRTRMGMGYTVAAIGALVGNPIAGAARRGGHRGSMEEVMERWQGAWFVAGTCLMISTGLMVAARYLRAGWDLKVKL